MVPGGSDAWHSPRQWHPGHIITRLLSVGPKGEAITARQGAFSALRGQCVQSAGRDQGSSGDGLIWTVSGRSKVGGEGCW